MDGGTSNEAARLRLAPVEQGEWVGLPGVTHRVLLAAVRHCCGASFAGPSSLVDEREDVVLNQVHQQQSIGKINVTC